MEHRKNGGGLYACRGLGGVARSNEEWQRGGAYFLPQRLGLRSYYLGPQRLDLVGCCLVQQPRRLLCSRTNCPRRIYWKVLIRPEIVNNLFLLLYHALSLCT